MPVGHPTYLASHPHARLRDEARLLQELPCCRIRHCRNAQCLRKLYFGRARSRSRCRRRPMHSAFTGTPRCTRAPICAERVYWAAWADALPVLWLRRPEAVARFFCSLRACCRYTDGTHLTHAGWGGSARTSLSKPELRTASWKPAYRAHGTPDAHRQIAA